MKKNDNIGRDFAFKEAFIRHLLKATDEIIPVTKELQVYMQRDRTHRVAVCADRMIDDAQKLLDKYNQTLKGANHGIHSPLPVILVAFSKDNQPIAADRGEALSYPRLMQLGDEFSQYYKMRMDHVEKRVQIAFFAHTSETAKSLTSQIRLYFQRFNYYRYPIAWHFGGYDFELTGSFQEFPVPDEVADLAERTNLTILVWNLTAQFQIPYLTAPEPHEYIQDNEGREVLKGYYFVNF